MSALLVGGGPARRVDLADPRNILCQNLIQGSYIVHGHEPGYGELDRRRGRIRHAKVFTPPLILGAQYSGADAEMSCGTMINVPAHYADMLL